MPRPGARVGRGQAVRQRRRRSRAHRACSGGDASLAAPVQCFPGQAASAGPVAFADLTGGGPADLGYPGPVLAVGGPDIVVVPAAQAP